VLGPDREVIVDRPDHDDVHALRVGEGPGTWKRQMAQEGSPSLAQSVGSAIWQRSVGSPARHPPTETASPDAGPLILVVVFGHWLMAAAIDEG
jgi:hypothetical protein